MFPLFRQKKKTQKSHLSVNDSINASIHAETCINSTLFYFVWQKKEKQKSSPLFEIFHFLLADSLPLLALVLHYECGILVENWILTRSQRLKVIQHGARVQVCWGQLHQPIRLLQHRVCVHIVPMMEKVLQKDQSVLILLKLRNLASQ